MPSRIATRISKHRRSTTIKQCQPHSPDCIKSIPQLPMSSFPGTQQLPCSCLRSHVMIEKISAELEKDSSAFSTITPYTSIFPLTTTLLHENKNTASTQSQAIWSYSRKFRYYLPRISSSSNGFCTSWEDAAYEIPATHNTPEIMFNPHAYEESVQLLVIHEQDF